jgi:hypothetical protein
MKNKICPAGVVAFMFIALSSINCSKDGGGDDFFIPILENQWTNKVDATNFFNFFNETPNTNTSTFEGNENANGNTFHFTGSFTNHNIQFTYDTDSTYEIRNGKTYSGTINDASTVMTLHSNDLGDLVLEKQ